ncbi:MAG: hypothetical protein II723_08600 [Oscillospiraceae bacterium]|nr:hypothetical protein [Oscillospiraceae bacterium]
MDISEIKSWIEKIIEKIKGDDGLKEKFTSDPAGTVRGLVGDAADNDTVSKIVDGVKSALSGGKLGAIGEKISGLVGGLFGKKDDGDKKDE